MITPYKEHSYVLPRPFTPQEQREFDAYISNLRRLAQAMVNPFYSVAIPQYRFSAYGEVEIIWPREVIAMQARVNAWFRDMVKAELKWIAARN